MSIKCVVWDLDNTLWEGVLLEGDPLRLRPGVKETLQSLDVWGILHSIASHNDAALAQEALESFGLGETFLAPQINFNPKPEQIAAIAQALDLRPEDLAYVDDDPFQRAQVAALLPAVTVLDEQEGLDLPNRPGLRPSRLTPEARTRRLFYQGRLRRDQAQASFAGSRSEFLASCDLRLKIRPARPEDVPRLYELIERTNQLNATAQRYDQEVVQSWLDDPGYAVCVGELRDRFGEYGMVGVAVVRTQPAPWLLQVLLVSCRAMGRGVGEGLLVSVLRQAQEAGQPALQALYRQTPHNQAMRLMFATHGFRPAPDIPGVQPAGAGEAAPVVYRHDLQGELPTTPAWLQVESVSIV